MSDHDLRFQSSVLRRRLGLPPWAIVGLALLGVPRILAHDLGITSPPIQGLLTLGPAIVWIFVVLRAKVPSPVVTLLAVGVVYGLALGIVHNLMWGQVFGDNPPELGVLDADTAEVPLRFATFVSSLFTGAAVGLVIGVIVHGLRAVGQRNNRAG
ncbi:hypothetical protein [Kribbella sp. NPDC048915]|uniref:hypothetical protein n=1 Tax=Kribbella sp. NPDC048915 TaxID=3155148 RepID=UPI0033CF730F